MQTPSGAGFGTLAVHAGQEPEPRSGAIMTPIYQTSTYVQDGVGRTRGGHEYARVTNPTRTALEANLAALEGGLAARTFASGLAATEAVLKSTLSAGDRVVCGDNLYGGSERLFRFWNRFGLEFEFVDTREDETVRQALESGARMLFLETPTNPLMQITDIEACAAAAHEAGALLVVDNTFATPWLQRPLDLGADFVVHSSTKYLGGHSDLIGGAVIVASEERDEALGWQQMATGAVPGPMDCFLLLRSTKTLHVRMRAHCDNAARVAVFLDEHPRVERVLYPGLAHHPQHDLARRQMRGFGGMITLDLGSPERAEALAGGTRVFSLAESLGGVESLISIPSRMTHASVPAERRERMGLTDSLVRLSVGIEDPDDLVADLANALESL
ncbi:MAG: cystathionine gamma-synthase [Gemmatimonadota bacterium]